MKNIAASNYYRGKPYMLKGKREEISDVFLKSNLYAI